MKRKTIKDEITYNGIGLHKGEKIEIKLRPVTDYSGITFKRVDLPGDNEIKVSPDNLFELPEDFGYNNSQKFYCFAIPVCILRLFEIRNYDLAV